jgi:hypothetical protein
MCFSSLNFNCSRIYEAREYQKIYIFFQMILLKFYIYCDNFYFKKNPRQKRNNYLDTYFILFSTSNLILPLLMQRDVQLSNVAQKWDCSHHCCFLPRILVKHMLPLMCLMRLI